MDPLKQHPHYPPGFDPKELGLPDPDQCQHDFDEYPQGPGEYKFICNKCKYLFTQGELEDYLHDADCKRGEHKFVECDEWEPTCLYCGKFKN